MDDLQYFWLFNALLLTSSSFKPCYKWMTFNTVTAIGLQSKIAIVLNLVINGWPSIPYIWPSGVAGAQLCFKPCYKWMTFNTL